MFKSMIKHANYNILCFCIENNVLLKILFFWRHSCVIYNWYRYHGAVDKTLADNPCWPVVGQMIFRTIQNLINVVDGCVPFQNRLIANVTRRVFNKQIRIKVCAVLYVKSVFTAIWINRIITCSLVPVTPRDFVV